MCLSAYAALSASGLLVLHTSMFVITFLSYMGVRKKAVKKLLAQLYDLLQKQTVQGQFDLF